MTIPLSPLHTGLPDGRFLLALFLGLPVLGAAQGLLAGAASLPVASRSGGWLLQREGSTATAPGWHLLAGAGIGIVHATLAVLAVVAAPERVLRVLATVHPSLWLGAANLAAVVLLGAAFLTAALPAGSPDQTAARVGVPETDARGGSTAAGDPDSDGSGLSRAARRTAVAYLLALSLVGFTGAELVVLLR
jgi:hypothetical protein